VGLTVGLDIVTKKKITCSLESSHPACSQVTIVTDSSRLSKDLKSEQNLQDAFYNSIQNILF
jgi:hypothetical protein